MYVYIAGIPSFYFAVCKFGISISAWNSANLIIKSGSSRGVWKLGENFTQFPFLLIFFSEVIFFYFGAQVDVSLY